MTGDATDLSRRVADAVASARTPEGVLTLLRALDDEGLLDLPLPGSGSTSQRWSTLGALAQGDLVIGRLAEAHTDGHAILAEARGCGGTAPDVKGQLVGVWASGSGRTGLRAERDEGGWRLDGQLRFCSGATLLDAALVPAAASDGHRLFLLPLEAEGVAPMPGTWPAIGMAESVSLDVDVRDVRLPEEAAVGPAGFYLSRPGFWVGGLGVAATWAGGVAALVDHLRMRLRDGEATPHQLAHLGACHSTLVAVRALLAHAAAEVDARPHDDHQVLAHLVRHAVEQAAQEAIVRSGRATGPVPLTHDPVHARRVADLEVFVRQQHAERDLERLGRLVLETR